MTKSVVAPKIWHPADLSEAWSLLKRFGKAARLLAGGTALQLDWAAGAPVPEHWIDINRIDGLRGIESLADGSLRIGALTSLSSVRHDMRIREALPVLAEAVARIGSAGIRNLATLGGNVAGGAGCIIPALLALDADVEIFTAKGIVRRNLAALLSSSLAPMDGTVLVAIIIPADLPAKACFEKIGLRRAFTPSVVNAAAGLWFDVAGNVTKARLAIGGGATPPQRLSAAECGLVGQPLSSIDWASLKRDMLGEMRVPADAFRSADYRRKVAANAILMGLGGADAFDAAGGRISAHCYASIPAFLPVPYSEAEVSRRTMGERWRMRPDVSAKVEGAFTYLTDIRKPDMLVGRVLRAHYPHARILAIDTSEAEALPGVHAVVTHRDVKGLNGYGIVVQDQPAFCADKVRYVGDAVAAVAAESEEIAERALGLIHVDYEVLPVVADAERALLPDAPLVHESGNLLADLGLERGKVDEAFARAAHVVEDVYVTPRQMHAFMETEGGYAEPTPEGGLLVCVAGQHGYRDRMQLARILGIDEERIRIVSSPSGGAFGGKDELTVQPALALLALKARRPVRLQLDRAESVLSGTKRQPMRIRMRTACDADGYLIAQEVDALADGGAYASLGASVVETALEHVTGAYRISNVRSRGRLAYTNNGFGGAFRGFGCNEMLFAVESQIGRLAQKAGFDPVTFRARNLRHPGDIGYMGQVVAPSDRGRETLAAAAASDLWARERGVSPDGRKVVGVGLAIALQGSGLGSAIGDSGAARLTLAADGKIEAAFGTEEIGQGVLALIQESVARVLGCERDDVRPVIGDTARTVDSGSTTASRMTYVIWRSASEAGPALRTGLLAVAAKELGREPEELAIGPGGIYDARRNSPDERLLDFVTLAQSLGDEERPSAECCFAFPISHGSVEGNARFLHCHSAVLARVAVDRVTGMVEVLDLDQHTAAGPVMDVANYGGQIEGGGVQALGFALTEDTLIEGGTFTSRNFDSYMVPMIADAPAHMRVFAMEELDADDPYGPRGVGELGIAAVAPAIAAAVADAVGVWVTEAPFNPEKILSRTGGMAASAE
ncbi:molybdopterin cofactor-binding domain-containing protein [Parvibaculum sp.]|uniref:molybdopterin cofactor-binding domain-containing protein n=1 Tax=Parvibaculum sp. TaxID=2024848 RepID=UPI00320E5C60